MNRQLKTEIQSQKLTNSQLKRKQSQIHITAKTSIKATAA